MTTTALKLKGCPRCKGALALIYDQYGGFWGCIQCGHHSGANVPPQPRVASSEAMRAYYSLFDYCGPEKMFTGLRIRGRLLPPKRNERGARFDINCPYRNCSRRQLAVLSQQSPPRRVYECANRHRIYIQVGALKWE